MSLTPYHRDDLVTLYHGDCIEVMRALPYSSVDAVVTDPPYGLEFMGKEWDAPWKGDVRAKFRDSSEVDDDSAHKMSQARGTFPEAYIAGPSFQSWCTEWATEALRVLKPGGHLLAFGGTRTWHRLACAIEDAGFEVRDNVAWMYGSGFPKSLDVSKAIDKAAGATREVVGSRRGNDITGGKYGSTAGDGSVDLAITGPPITPEAARWQGWGTALKPAFEPAVVARRPLIGTVAANVLAHGTGALNVDAARISADEGRPLIISKSEESTGILGDGLNGSSNGGTTTQGRWPANVILDESQARALDAMSGVSRDGVVSSEDRGKGGIWSPSTGKPAGPQHGDTGGASRFFYTAKADSSERPSYVRPVMRLRADLTAEQVDLVTARLREAGVRVD